MHANRTNKREIFKHCCCYTLDPFWTGIFTRMSKGEMPEGLSFDETTCSLTVSDPEQPDSVATVCMQDKTVRQVYKTVTNVLRSRGVLSQYDLPNPLPVIVPSDWDDIKSKAAREELLVKWIFRQWPEDVHCKWQQYSTVLRGDCKKNSYSIVLQDGEIYSVELYPSSVGVGELQGVWSRVDVQRDLLSMARRKRGPCKRDVGEEGE